MTSTSTASPGWILIGDILHPGKVQVWADTPEEAVEKAEEGDFTVYDEMGKCLAFRWNGDVVLDAEGNEVQVASNVPVEGREAARYVAAQMAYLAFQHHQAAEAVPCLAANSEAAIRRLHDAATVLGFAPEFGASCSRLDVRLLDGRVR